MSVAAALVVCTLSGCTVGQGSNGFLDLFKKTPAKTDAAANVNKDNLSLSGRGFVREPIDPKNREELDKGHRLMQEKKYGEAEKIFNDLAKTTGSDKWGDFNLFGSGFKERPIFGLAVYEEALFNRAECQRFQKNYRDAGDSYTKLLVEIPQSRYVQRSCQGLWAIADHWLEPTRRQMDEFQEQLQGKRKFVMPAAWVNFSKEMPWTDAEGHAVNVLNTIRSHDINGPLGERALFCLGTIHFFRKDYKDADFYFTELYKKYPNSKESPKAIRQSIICKQLMTGGTVYDLRTVEESKKLLMVAQASYQELARDQDWVESQLKSINIQQADRDFKIAEFYQRTGHPGSAYFYYELVCRRYPGTMFAADAAKRKGELRAKAPAGSLPPEEPAPEASSRQPQPYRLPEDSFGPASPRVAPGVAPPPGVRPPGPVPPSSGGVAPPPGVLPPTGVAPPPGIAPPPGVLPSGIAPPPGVPR